MAPQSIFQWLAKWLLVALFASSGLAMAQPEPTMGQIYSTAQAGKLDEAQVMVQQVLLAHPKSAKAYYVQAELYARQGKLDSARAALSSAEQLSPGLAFAKPESLGALRAQLAGRSAVHTRAVAPGAYPVQRQNTTSSASWALPVLLTVGVMLAGYFIFRRRDPSGGAPQPAYANPNGLNGPQSPYSPGGYPQPGYVQPTGSGLGGRIMGGVATGLAVGAGVMAAEAIGRNLMGGHNSPSLGSQDAYANDSYQPSNTDMGGADFGIRDAGSWDDGGSVDMGGSSDWDN
jgi:hypothetical protein